MKAKTKWGISNTFAERVIKCPQCEFLFVVRRKQGCPKCQIKLYAGSEYLYDRNGFWWDPKLYRWIPVKDIGKMVNTPNQIASKILHNSLQ